MTKTIFGWAMVFGLFLLSLASVSAQKNSKTGAVCGDASKAECTKDDAIFKPHSLIFKLSPKAAKDPEQYAAEEQSEFFYAVLLETVNGYKEGGCREISEAKRLAAQEMFPNNKAFTYNYYCENPGTGDKFVGYKFPNVNDSTHLLAIYGGATQSAAAKILATAKKKYPKARVVKMRAVVVEQLDV